VGKRERYEPGTFCWVDLATTDPAGAKAFYGELFGWEAEDMPAGGGATYTMLRLDGDYVCALYEMDAERLEQGVPPHWFSYVSVEDADATAARARELGGTVYGEAFDVLDAGRMAVIQDPTGAVFGAWQPRAHIGARRVNDPGCLTLNELHTRDPEAAITFYAGLFGWETEVIEENGEPVYGSINNAGSLNGGLMPMTEEHGDAPSYWLPYFTVPSIEGAVAKIRELDGELMAGPLDVPAGRITVLSDPQGAAFALFEGETDD
jgi:predicted enzyme related to lactoylglutathione lyase